MSTGEFNAGGGGGGGGNPAMDLHPIQGGGGSRNNPRRFMPRKPRKTPVGWATRLKHRLYFPPPPPPPLNGMEVDGTEAPAFCKVTLTIHWHPDLYSWTELFKGWITRNPPDKIAV